MPTPLGNKIIVTPDPTREKTIGGIIIPETAVTPFKAGTVTAIPQGLLNAIKKGDHVNFHRSAGIKMRPDEETLIMTAEEIWWID